MDEWLNSADFSGRFSFTLRMFFADCGDRVVLNVIRDCSNIGQFYCPKADFESALAQHRRICVTDCGGRQLTVMPAPLQTLEVLILSDSLRVLIG